MLDCVGPQRRRIYSPLATEPFESLCVNLMNPILDTVHDPVCHHVCPCLEARTSSRALTVIAGLWLKRPHLSTTFKNPQRCAAQELNLFDPSLFFFCLCLKNDKPKLCRVYHCFCKVYLNHSGIIIKGTLVKFIQGVSFIFCVTVSE